MNTENTKWKEEQLITPAILAHLARQGVLPIRAHLRGLTLIGEIPSAASWHTFLWRMLLFLGAGFLVTGIFFFFAWNWDDMHRLTKLGVLQGLVVVSAGIAWQQRLNIVGKITLTAASLLVGAVLGVYGQQYQVRADAWQIVGLWTLLMLGWVTIGRFPTLWMIWQILLNITAVLFGIQRDLQRDILLGIVFIINVVGMMLWEWAHGRFDGLATRWPVRLSGLAALTALFIPTVAWIAEQFYVDSTRALIANMLALIAYGGLSTAILTIYRGRPRDLPLLALTLLSMLVMATVGISTLLFETLDLPIELAGLLVGLFILAVGATIARYIYRLTNQEVSNE